MTLSRTLSPTSLLSRSALTALVATSLLLTALPAGARGRPEGEEVVVAGSITDSNGSPVEGVTVELHASRWAFSIRDFRITNRGGRRATATTDTSGTFEISWNWHPYYNRLELVAGVPSGAPERERELEILSRLDLSKRMKRSNPVVATLEIPDRSPVDALNQFLAGLDSADKLRVYQEVGKPDKVRLTDLPASQETSWWFFEQGKVYRFRNGRIESVEDFEPVVPSPG